MLVVVVVAVVVIVTVVVPVVIFHASGQLRVWFASGPWALAFGYIEKFEC